MLEYLWEVVVHGTCYALMLLPPQVAKLADSSLQLFLGIHETAIECLALGCQLVVVVGGGQQRVQLGI